MCVCERETPAHLLYLVLRADRAARSAAAAAGVQRVEQTYMLKGIYFLLESTTQATHLTCFLPWQHPLTLQTHNPDPQLVAATASSNYYDEFINVHGPSWLSSAVATPPPFCTK